MVVVTVAQDDGIEWAEANTQGIGIWAQDSFLAGVKENSPIIALDQHRQTVLREQIGSRNKVIHQHGHPQPLNHRGVTSPFRCGGSVGRFRIPPLDPR
jgi:hypothetical protein